MPALNAFPILKSLGRKFKRYISSLSSNYFSALVNLWEYLFLKSLILGWNNLRNADFIYGGRSRRPWRFTSSSRRLNCAIRSFFLCRSLIPSLDDGRSDRDQEHIQGWSKYFAHGLMDPSLGSAKLFVDANHVVIRAKALICYCCCSHFESLIAFSCHECKSAYALRWRISMGTSGARFECYTQPLLPQLWFVSGQSTTQDV